MQKEEERFRQLEDHISSEERKRRLCLGEEQPVPHRE